MTMEKSTPEETTTVVEKKEGEFHFDDDGYDKVKNVQLLVGLEVILDEEGNPCARNHEGERNKLPEALELGLEKGDKIDVGVDVDGNFVAGTLVRSLPGDEIEFGELSDENFEQES